MLLCLQKLYLHLLHSDSKAWALKHESLIFIVRISLNQQLIPLFGTCQEFQAQTRTWLQKKHNFLYQGFPSTSCDLWGSFSLPVTQNCLQKGIFGAVKEKEMCRVGAGWVAKKENKSGCSPFSDKRYGQYWFWADFFSIRAFRPRNSISDTSQKSSVE